MSCRSVLPVLALLLMVPVIAHAQDEDIIPGESFHWQVQVRALYLIPSNHALPQTFNLNGAVQGELSGEWAFTPRWSTELAIATPAALDVQGGPGSIRVTTQILTLKYYFPGTGGFSPYLGTGIYHSTASADNTAPNIGVNNPGIGWVLQGGVTYAISPNLFVSGDLRYEDGLEPTLFVDGTPSGHIGIDPVVIGVGVGLRF